LGPRLATGKYAHITQSARTTASLAAKSNQRLPVLPENELTMEDFLNKDSILQRNYYLEGILLPGDEDYNKADNLFSNTYGIPKLLLSLLLMPIPSQLV
jgi:hypothetical protein